MFFDLRKKCPCVYLPILAITAIIIFAGCSGDSSDQSSEYSSHGRQNPGSSSQPVPVAVQTSEIGPIASYYNATATLEAEKSAQVLARVTGVVLSVDVEEGDLVEDGSTLLRIANDEYKLRLAQAEARTSNLRARYNRLEALFAEQLTTDEELLSARSDLTSAETDENVARLNLSYTTVRAPFAGRVTERLVDVGQNLSTGSAVYTVADFNPLLARVHVPSKEFNKLQIEQEVDLILDSDQQQLRGRIKLISPVIDPNSGTIKVTIEIDDYPASVRPGDFTEVKIVTELRPSVVLVPRSAVITEKGESVVFVVGEPGSSEMTSLSPAEIARMKQARAEKRKKDGGNISSPGGRGGPPGDKARTENAGKTKRIKPDGNPGGGGGRPSGPGRQGEQGGSVNKDTSPGNNRQRSPAGTHPGGSPAAGETGDHVADANEVVAHRVVVETGFTNDNHCEIISGLTAGNRVIVKGQRSLKDGDPIKILEDSSNPVSIDSPPHSGQGR